MPSGSHLLGFSLPESMLRNQQNSTLHLKSGRPSGTGKHEGENRPLDITRMTLIPVIYQRKKRAKIKDD